MFDRNDKAPPPDPNIQKILDIVTADLALDEDTNERVVEIAANILFLTQEVDTLSQWVAKIAQQNEEILAILQQSGGISATDVDMIQTS